MANFIVAQLGTAFTQDPVISLLNYIQTNWTITDPPVGDINFDTKFRRYKLHLHVIVENIGEPKKAKDLGASRFGIVDTKRIQIRSTGIAGSKDKLWKMKERIEEIINANPRGMQTNGITLALIKDWQDITSNISSDNPEEPLELGIVGGFFLVELRYDKVKV